MDEVFWILLFGSVGIVLVAATLLRQILKEELQRCIECNARNLDDCHAYDGPPQPEELKRCRSCGLLQRAPEKGETGWQPVTDAKLIDLYKPFPESW